MRALVVALVVAAAAATIVLTRRRTRPSARLAAVTAQIAGSEAAEAVDGPTVERGHRRVAGCLGVGAGCGLLVLVAPLVFLVLVTRACDDDGWLFDVRVVRLTEAEVCFQLIDDGPGYLDGCNPIEVIEIVGLPQGIVVGECLELREFLHGDLEYVGRATCPSGR